MQQRAGQGDSKERAVEGSVDEEQDRTEPKEDEAISVNDLMDYEAKSVEHRLSNIMGHVRTGTTQQVRDMAVNYGLSAKGSRKALLYSVEKHVLDDLQKMFSENPISGAAACLRPITEGGHHVLTRFHPLPHPMIDATRCRALLKTILHKTQNRS